MDPRTQKAPLETPAPLLVSSDIIQAVLTDPPRNSAAIRAELLFLDGYYIFHYREKDSPGADIYKCVSPSALRTAFSHEPVDSSWVQPGIVRFGTGSKGTYLIKFIPAAMHLLNCDELGTLKIPFPSMVFMGLEKNYWVWALKSKAIDPNAPAFHVPLPNVYNSGQICWGTNEPPTTDFKGIEIAWNLFISSVFTNHLTAGKSKSRPSDIRQQLVNLHQKDNRSSYPISDLMPIGNKKSVDALVQEILDERNP
jgi:PRTRC genetic system protein B